MATKKASKPQVKEFNARAYMELAIEEMMKSCKGSYPDKNPDRVSGYPAFAIEISQDAETATFEPGIRGPYRIYYMIREATNTLSFYVTGISRNAPFRAQVADNQQQSYVTGISRL